MSSARPPVTPWPCSSFWKAWSEDGAFAVTAESRTTVLGDCQRVLPGDAAHPQMPHTSPLVPHECKPLASGEWRRKHLLLPPRRVL